MDVEADSIRQYVEIVYEAPRANGWRQARVSGSRRCTCRADGRCGGLFTVRVDVVFTTSILRTTERTAVQIRYRDLYRPNDIGWWEVTIAAGDGVAWRMQPRQQLIEAMS